MRQVCAVTYVMLIDLIESRTQSVFLATVMAKTSGGEGAEDIEIVMPHEARDRFDEWLRCPPSAEDATDRILTKALFPGR